MKGNHEAERASEKGFLRRLLEWITRHKYLVITITFAIIVLFIDKNNLIAYYKLRREVATQNHQKKYYEEAIISTDERLKELSSNKDSLERFAREQFLFHEDNEDLFIIDKGE